MSYSKMENAPRFSDCLSGPNAFYKNENYITNTNNDFQSAKPLEPVYEHNTQSKVVRYAKNLFSVLFFPIAIGRYLHNLVGKIIVPASRGGIDRTNLTLDSDRKFKMKRIAIKVDGYVIDAAILGTERTLSNGRWVLKSNGNNEYYENTIELIMNYGNDNFREMLTDLNANSIVFNYSGVGSSTGMPNRDTLAKAYKAILEFLEDKEKGIGAKEIIGYGHSLGGAVQGAAIADHKMKPGVKYVWVKSKTFSTLATTVKEMFGPVIGRIAAALVKIFGWNMDTVESSKKLKNTEIIIEEGGQPLKPFEFTRTSQRDPAFINVHDGVIPAEASLAQALLEAKIDFPAKKIMVADLSNHNAPLSRDGHISLVNAINKELKTCQACVCAFATRGNAPSHANARMHA